MKIKLLCVLFISIFFYTTAFAQQETDPKKHSLEFSTGYNSGSLKNLEFAPISRYDYNGLVSKLKYERTSNKRNLFTIQLAYLNSTLESDLIPVLNLDYSKIGMLVSYLKEVYHTDKFSMHVGLQSHSNVSIYAQENENRIIVDQSFGLASQFSYKINHKHSLFSKLSIPMVLFRVTDANANIFSLNKYQGVLWNVGYKHAISEDFDLKFSYDFNYDRLQIPNAFREVQYQFNLGLNFKF